MDPEARKRLDAERILRLGHLGLVVGEDEISAAAVDVDAGTEVAAGHRRTLDVPPWAARPEWGIPSGFVRSGFLPEDKIERIALVRVVGGVSPLVGDRQHFRTRDVAELAELRIAIDREVDIAA